MSRFNRVEVECLELARIADRYRESGDFFSVFFTPATSGDYPKFGLGLKAVLIDVLESEFFRECLPELFPLDMEAAMQFTSLDSYEFEGSLVGKLVAGACIKNVVHDEHEAREVVQAILRSIPRSSEFNIWAFRMDDANWSAFMSGATMSYAYFAYSPATAIWWFIGFADFY